MNRRLFVGFCTLTILISCSDANSGPRSECQSPNEVSRFMDRVSPSIRYGGSEVRVGNIRKDIRSSKMARLGFYSASIKSGELYFRLCRAERCDRTDFAKAFSACVNRGGIQCRIVGIQTPVCWFQMHWSRKLTKGTRSSL